MKKLTLFSILLMGGTAVLSSSDTQAQAKDEKTDHARMTHMPDLSSWPKASQMAAKEIIKKYGKPDVMGEEMLGWVDAGPWKRIHITKAETKHSFPIEHTDMMETSLSYKVDPAKYDELGVFDGSVVVDRTQGLLSARCDMEANNFLALNLANDIITGKKTVAQARKAYGEIVKEKMEGGNPEYMQKLVFSTQHETGDPDENTTGLTKEDVMNKKKG